MYSRSKINSFFDFSSRRGAEALRKAYERKVSASLRLSANIQKYF
jgi:hypothetical protein